MKNFQFFHHEKCHSFTVAWGKKYSSPKTNLANVLKTMIAPYLPSYLLASVLLLASKLACLHLPDLPLGWLGQAFLKICWSRTPKSVVSAPSFI